MDFLVPLMKEKRERKAGQKLAQLNEDIHERDDYTCIVPGCGRHVALGEKFHHEPGGAKKQDRIDKGVCLCYAVHHPRRHFGPNSKEIKVICQEYLSERYDEDGKERIR